MDSSITTISNSPSATLIRIRCGNHRQTVWSIGPASWYTRLLSWGYRTVPGSTHVRPRRVYLRRDRQPFPFALSAAFAWGGLVKREPHAASAARSHSPLHGRPCSGPAATVRSPCHRGCDATAVTATDRTEPAPCTNATRVGSTTGRDGDYCYHSYCRWRRDASRRAQGNHAVLAFPRTTCLAQAR